MIEFQPHCQGVHKFDNIFNKLLQQLKRISFAPGQIFLQPIKTVQNDLYLGYLMLRVITLVLTKANWPPQIT